MAACNFCVSYGQRTKLLTVSSADPGLLKNLKLKINSKFSVDSNDYTIKLKLEQFKSYVDIDQEDPDDLELLENGGSILLEQVSDCASASSDVRNQSPERSTSDEAQNQVSLDNRTSDKPAKLTSAKVKVFDVREIVRKHPRGGRIEEEYSKNNTITSETRHLLITIVSSEMISLFTYYPSREEKVMVAKSIIAAYPSLGSNSRCPYDIWFDPTDATRGYLSTKLNTMRRSLPTEHQQRPRTGKYKGIIKPQMKESIKRTYDHLEEISSDEEEELILFSKRATADSRDQILDAMQKTFQNRRNWILSETSQSAKDVLERYPRFRDTPAVVSHVGMTVDVPFGVIMDLARWPGHLKRCLIKDLTKHGFVLYRTPVTENLLDQHLYFSPCKIVCARVQQEFKLLFPAATAKLISKWETRFVQGILHIAKMSRLPKIQALMQDLSSPVSEAVSDNDGQYVPSDGEISLYAFLAAVYLLPSNSGKRTSLADAVQYFLVTKPHGTSVEAFLQDQRKQPAQRRTQPYLLGIGMRRRPAQYFVIIDEQAIPCNTGPDITQAVDIMFKIHYIFNIHYAAELKAFYAFLEHYVYDIGITGNAIPVRAKELMSNITALSNKEVMSLAGR